MMRKKITCKVHDENKVIVKVGIEGERVYPIIAVWNDIINERFEFYTIIDGKEAKVFAREKNGTKYLTTSPDGIIPNNLDELPNCY